MTGRGTLARLARTRSAPDDLALLRRGLHSRRLVLLKSLLTRLEQHPAAVPETARERFEEHWRLLERAESLDGGAARRTLDYPAVGIWLADALAAPDGEALARRLDRFGAVAATAAVRCGLDFTLDLPAPGGSLALPGTGRLRHAGASVRLTARARTVRLTAEDGHPGAVLLRAAGQVSGSGPGWQGLATLPGSDARLDDLDPHRAPPGGVGHTALPPAPPDDHEAWSGLWRAALSLLHATDPARAAETTALLRCVVPLARTGRHGARSGPVSATLRAAPGAVLTTWPETAAGLAEVLVHETQHGKLAVLHDLVPLHRGGPAARHRVAWRADPRPFAAVLQGTYAHLALADFWARAAGRRTRPPGARRAAAARRDDYREQVAAALPILLESGELTAAGRQFAIGMERHLAGLGREGDQSAGSGGASPLCHVQ
ncbi:HEXXH motif-containing putative peptide modification protein [Streptomyces sp. NPDC049577]|uniref:aKG-HExxH-type peptide beta-hydroxylase n=1 Tax=Streptomyces sp. NPDC049577 TaxID=3155153 RepID=UPI003431A2F4